jgi:hypothetical protein
MNQNAQHAKALLSEKPYLKGFKVFEKVTTWVTGNHKTEYFIKQKRLFGWKWVKRQSKFGKKRRILSFDSEAEARRWIEEHYPPKIEVREV